MWMVTWYVYLTFQETKIAMSWLSKSKYVRTLAGKGATCKLNEKNG